MIKEFLDRFGTDIEINDLRNSVSLDEVSDKGNFLFHPSRLS